MTDVIPNLAIYDMNCRPVGNKLPDVASQYHRCMVVGKNSGECIRKATQFFQRLFPEAEVKGIDILSFTRPVGPEQAIIVC